MRVAAALCLLALAGCVTSTTPEISSSSRPPLDFRFSPATVLATCDVALPDGSHARCGNNGVVLQALSATPLTMACMIGFDAVSQRLDWWHGPGVSDTSGPIEQGISYQLDGQGSLLGVLWDLRDEANPKFTWSSDARTGFIQPHMDGTGENLEMGGVVLDLPVLLNLSRPPDDVNVWWQLYYLGIESYRIIEDYESWGLHPIIELTWGSESVYLQANFTKDGTIGSNHSGNAQGQIFGERTLLLEVDSPSLTGTIQLNFRTFYGWLDSATDPFWTTTCETAPALEAGASATLALM